MWLTIALSVLAVPVSFLLWAALHEVSHYVVLKQYQPTASCTFHLYPHRYEGTFYWARISWEATGLVPMTADQIAWVAAAPRAADLLGAVFTPIMCWALFPSFLPVILLVGGGIVDLVVGSIGWNQNSDLQRMARGWDISPWAFRISGFAFALASVAFTLTSFF